MRLLSLRSVLAGGLLLALAAPATRAQPAAERVFAEWVGSQRAARAEAGVVRFVERADREVEGPAMARRVRTEAAVALRPGGPDRRVTYAEVDGRPVPPRRFARLERRMAEALGPGALWTQHAPLPALLADLRPRGDARATERDGRAAWAVRARGTGGPRGADEATLWFSRDGGPPRLLHATFERRLPDGGSSSLAIDFAAVGALDLPARHHAEAAVRQRRRIRLFTVLVRTEVTYGGYAVGAR